MKTRSNPRSARPSPPMPQGAAAVMCAVLLASSAALAAGPVAPVGPVGPIGPVGVQPEVPRPGRPALPRPAAPPKPSASGTSAGAGAGNRIEVSGNSASGTHCAEDGTASVNSVDVSGARLEGRTVIVQGRNTNNVRTTDCPERTGQPPQGQGGRVNSNSIHIR